MNLLKKYRLVVRSLTLCHTRIPGRETFTLYVCYFICSCALLSAQFEQKLAFTPIDNGLSNEWVSCITQDSIGFIWIGTQDGLYRYDGYRFEVLRNSPEEPQSPAANWIRDITIDAKNNFWLATYGGGVTKFSPGKMDFMNFSKGGSNAFQGKLVSHIAPAGKNHVVSSWEEGYAIFNVKTNTHTKLGVEAFKSALTSKDETLWLAGSNNTLLSYDIKTSVLKQVFTFEAPIYLLKYIPKIGLLVSLPNKLLLLKEGTVVNEIATDEVFTLITHDQRGNYYMATSSSIVKWDLDRFHIEPIATDLNVPELKITALFADRQGSLWVGTDKGLFKERKYNIAFLQTRIPLHARRIIKHDEVLYIGGDNGLFKVERDRTTCLADTKRVMGLLREAGQLFASTDDATVYKFIGDSLSTTIPISTKRGAVPAKWGHVDWNILRSKPVFTAGYPGIQPDSGFKGRPWITDGTYYSEQPFGWINGGESGLLYTDMDGTGGQSGSPAYSLLTPSQHDGPGIIRKVHGVFIGSPVAACNDNRNWVTPIVVTCGNGTADEYP